MIVKVWCPDDETEAEAHAWPETRDDPEEAAERFVSDGFDCDGCLGVTRVNVRELDGTLH